jgi:SpoVK/Ycf46/Vps4 family AAA+-type ATPase
VIATANDISSLPPELLRKGRFDEWFFVDLPNDQERAEIVKTALREVKRENVAIDFAAVSKATKDYTGAEIAAIVPEALFASFEDGARELTTEDLINVAGQVVPLAKTAETKIAGLRKWAADGNARRATPLPTGVVSTGRQVDLD